jgi:hypothetical protein
LSFLSCLIHGIYHGKQKCAKFEEYLKADLDLQKLSNMMFFVWDGNHRLQAWLPYIDRMHKTKENWHVTIDSIILDKIRGLSNC